jgi:hypothetical protein
MLGWDFPFGIVVTVVAGVVIAALLFRVGRKKSPEFECDVCGRKQQGLAAREWRFCPYCGTPHKIPPRIPGVQL